MVKVTRVMGRFESAKSTIFLVGLRDAELVELCDDYDRERVGEAGGSSSADCGVGYLVRAGAGCQLLLDFGVAL